MAVLEVTTASDPDLQRLVVAQEAEVLARYGADEAGPGLAGDTPCLLADVDGRPSAAWRWAASATGWARSSACTWTPARGLRLGRLLLDGVEGLAVERGCRLLRLETGTEQSEALRLYESAGWVRIECYGFWKDDPTTICSEQALPAADAR